MKQLLDSDAVTISSFLAESDERVLAYDVLDGLTRPFKELPPKHFYDARGSELFEQICELPEYYQTRTERAILERWAPEIVAANGAQELLELGSGSAQKARILIRAMAGARTLASYVPVDVSEQALREAAAQLVAEHPRLRVHGLVADFERHLEGIPRNGDRPRLVALLGGTIGNFPPGTRRRLLKEIAGLLVDDDLFLLGVDLVKDLEVLEAAYNDSLGITAEFNRNVLSVINRELDGDFRPDEFKHVAFFDRRHEWIEMRLRAEQPQMVVIDKLGLAVEFAAEEELRTEISAKFTRPRVEVDLRAAGLRVEHWYTDPEELFALVLASRR